MEDGTSHARRWILIAAILGILATTVFLLKRCPGTHPRQNIDKKHYPSAQVVQMAAAARSRFKALRDVWEATASADMKGFSQAEPSELDNFRRTFVVDFDMDMNAGPKERLQVLCWAEVAIATARVNTDSPNWWTIASHGTRVKHESSFDIARTTIVDEAKPRWGLSPPALSIDVVNTAFRSMDKARSDIMGWEHESLLLFLLACQTHLKGGYLELMACELGEAVDFSQPCNRQLVLRLAALLPGTRIVVYSGDAQWKGEHKVKSDKCSVYVWIAP